MSCLFMLSTIAYSQNRVLEISKASATDSSMTLEVTDTLPDSLYYYPVTLRRPLPESWPSDDVTKNSVVVPMLKVLVDTVVYLTFDVIPDAGEVFLARNMTPVTPEIDTIPEDEPNPVNIDQPGTNTEDIKTLFSEGRLILFLNTSTDRDLVVSIYDVRGVKLFSEKLPYSGEH